MFRQALYNPRWPGTCDIGHTGIELIQVCLLCLLKTGTKGVCHHTQFHLILMKPCSRKDIEMDLLQELNQCLGTVFNHSLSNKFRYSPDLHYFYFTWPLASLWLPCGIMSTKLGHFQLHYKNALNFTLNMHSSF